MLEELTFYGCGGSSTMEIDPLDGRTLSSIPFIFPPWQQKTRSGLSIQDMCYVAAILSLLSQAGSLIGNVTAVASRPSQARRLIGMQSVFQSMHVMFTTGLATTSIGTSHSSVILIGIILTLRY